MPYLIIAHDNPGMEAKREELARLIVTTSPARAKDYWRRALS